MISTSPRKTAIFLLSLSTIVFELLLTRVFSVTMWYHFAFMAISLAMFGMTAGAVIVHVFSRFFTQENTDRHIALASVGFAVATVLAFVSHLSIPFVSPTSVTAILSLVLNFTVISIPFVFSGIGITLLLTRGLDNIGKLYAADLAGAAIGCVLLFLVMRVLDAPSAVLATAAIGSTAAIALRHALTPRARRWAVVLGGTLLVAAGVNGYLAANQQAPLRLLWVKGALDPKPLYETWNSYSRVAVYDDPLIARQPFGWGLSSTYTPDSSFTRQYLLNIDAGAGTVLTEFKGDLSNVDYLKYDLTNLAHYLRPRSSVLAMGSGGGRDVLSALVFGQRSVTGVEINDAIVRTVTDRFGRFTGHLDRYPNVRFVNEEARSFISSSTEKFGIIQVSLIDTWAATAAGAFALSENTLYTTEAWQTFLEHLTPGGVITFSRWWVKENPAEIYRLVSLAAEALRTHGVSDPRKHIMLAYNPTPSSGGPDGIGTILVSDQPFSQQDIHSVRALCQSMAFELVLDPTSSQDPILTRLATGRESEQLSQELGLILTAPTDNDPFFFHVLSMSSVFFPSTWEQGGVSFNLKAVVLLLVVLALVLVLTIVAIVLPLRLAHREPIDRRGRSLLIYFAAIGLAFMLVEIAQIQRLNIFLGHPALSLTLVLGSILLASGAGSAASQSARLGSDSTKLLVLSVICALMAITTPYVLRYFHGEAIVVRAVIAVLLVVPLGFFMGMAFPIGMRVAKRQSLENLTPWLWGVNGAMSVCASVLAMVIAIDWGITAAALAGSAVYALAWLTYTRMQNRSPVPFSE